MSVKPICFAWVLAFLMPGLAAAQPPGPSGSAEAKRPPAASMSEDVEIFRRLLNDKLQGHYQPVQSLRAALASQCQSCHGVPSNFGSKWNTSTLQQVYPSVGSQFLANDTRWFYNPAQQYLTPSTAQPFPQQMFREYHQNWPVTNHFPQWLNAIDQTHDAYSPHRLLDTEGVYLKGQGVVYTLTVAPPPQPAKAEASRPAPRQLSDWERLQNEVRQETPRPPAEAPLKRAATLPEVILKALADNGRHFTRLSENESLTVVVTFRTVDRPAVAATPAEAPKTDTPSNTATALQGLVAAQAKSDDKDATRSAAILALAMNQVVAGSSVQDYELLGDLHQKQGKNLEAVAAYQKALEQKPESDQAAKLHRKLAQAYLALGMDAEAERAVRSAIEWLKKRQAVPPPPAPVKAAAAPSSPLPGKLIVSASKKLLDQVASGQLSIEAFQKFATVEYVNYPAPAK